MSVFKSRRSHSEAQFMKKLELCSQGFGTINPHQVRIYLNSLYFGTSSNITPKQRILQCFEVFARHKGRKQLDLMVKIVCFIHIIYQQIYLRSQKVEQIQEHYNILIQQLKKVREDILQFKSKANRSYSKNALEWVKRKVSISKEKSPKHRIRTNTQVSQQTQSIRLNQETQQTRSAIFRDRKHLETDINSIPEIINHKILKSYVNYLLKLIGAPLHHLDEDQNLWKLINLLLPLTAICENFEHILRYSSLEHKSLIVFIIKIIHIDIKDYYGQVFDIMKKKKQTIDAMFKRCQSSQQIRKNQGKLLKELKLEEYKHFLQQISVINESLTLIYFNKSLKHDLEQNSIFFPKIISTSAKGFDFIFDMVIQHERKEEKSKSKSKDVWKKTPVSNKDKFIKRIEPNQGRNNQEKNNQGRNRLNPALQERNRLKMSIKFSDKTMSQISQQSSIDKSLADSNLQTRTSIHPGKTSVVYRKQFSND